MANANNDRFSYQAMSNVVLSQDRRSRGRAGRDAPPGTTGEAGSLRNRSLFSMGDKAGPSSKGGSRSSQLADLRRARDAARARLEKRGELGGIPGLYVGAASSSASSAASRSRRTGATYLTTRPSSVAAANRAASTAFSSSSLGYRPRTSETLAAYEDLLSFVASLLPDGTSEDLLASFAEQALIILKSDEFINVRRPELAQLFSRKDTGDGAFLDTYNTLTEFGRRISDFDVDQAKEAGAAELEAAQAQARIEHVSVVHRDDGGESGNGKSTGGDGFDSGDEDMMAADAQGSNGMGFEVVDANMSSDAEDDDPLADSMDDEEDDLANGDGDGELLDGASTTAAAERISASSNTLPCREIDAYWLQRQLSHHYPDATKSQQMAEQVLETLEAGIVIKDEQQADEAMDIDSDDDDVSEKASHSQAQYNVRAVENNLFLLLEVDASASSRAKVSLIHTLLHETNPFRVVYCTRLRQAQTPDAIAAATAAASRTNCGRAILLEIDRDDKGRDASGWAADRERAAAAQSRNSGTTGSGGALGDRVAAEIQELEQQRKRQTNLSDQNDSGVPDKKNEAVNWQGKLKTVDLSALAFAEGGRYMGAKRVELPEGTWRAQKKGYEEYHIPAVTFKADPNDPVEIVPIATLPEWSRPAFGKIKRLNRMQSRCADVAFRSPENLLICAPTGAGKTNVACLTMLREIGLHLLDNADEPADPPDPSASSISVDLSAFKIVYVAPMKALVKEVVQSFNRRLGYIPGLKVRELSGDVSLSRREVNETTVIVTTPEKWDIVTRKSHSVFAQSVTLLIVDEIHLLHDDRGPVLEAIIARTLRDVERTGRQVRIVGLSATLPNFEDVATFCRVIPSSGLLTFGPEHRPVPLQQQYIGITERKVQKRLALMNQICYKKITGAAPVLDENGADAAEAPDPDTEMDSAASRAAAASFRMQQALVFTHTRKDTGETARALLEMAVNSGNPEIFLTGGGGSAADRALVEILRQEAEECADPVLREIIPCGLGMHHAGMTRADRDRVERLFRDKRLMVLCSTATLAWGVNLPAHTVIIKGTQVYDPSKGGHVELSPQDVMQMIGRAGRPGYDSSGEGIIITTHEEVQFYLGLLNEQLPIESQLGGPRLVDTLNAEIQLGSITSVQEAVEWLRYTYLYVRTLRSPKTYKVGLGIAGFDAAKDPTLRSHRIRMVHTAMVHLHRCGLVRYDPRARSVQPTPQGRIASHYYLSCDSMRTITRAMRPTLGDVGILRLFAMCHEFQNVRCRRSEKLELRTLLSRVPIPVRESVDDNNVIVAAPGETSGGAPATSTSGATLGQTGSGAAKVNVLLQAYISRLPLKGFALAADMVYIRQSAARLFRALFELSLRRGWSRLSLRLLGWCQMVEHRMWKSRTPLRQFVTSSPSASTRGSNPAETELSATLLAAMERRAVPWSTLKEMRPHELGELVVRQGGAGSGGARGSATTQIEVGKLLYRKIHQLPCLAVGATVQPLSRSTLRVELSLQADFQWPHPHKQKNGTLRGDANSATSVYPSGIDFHIIVEDGDGDKVLHHERFHLRKRELETAHVRVFNVPLFDPLPPQYFIRVVCDRWMHCSVTVPVVFRNQMVLPALNPPPTALLDLRPVKFGESGGGGDLDARHASLLSLAHPSWGGCLNAIQTQCLPVLYETDANVLLCAPPGTGKVGAAEVAVLRTLGFGKKDGQLNQLRDGSTSARVVYVCSRRGRCRMVLQRWKRMIEIGLGMKVAGLGFETGEVSAIDRESDRRSKNHAEDVLAANDVVITTTRAWEFVSRSWQRSAAVQGVRLLVVDQMQLVGAEGGSLDGGGTGKTGSMDGGMAEGGDDDDGGLDYLEEAALGGIGGTASVAAELELVVSRMRFMSAQLKGNGGPGVRIVALSSCMANGVDVGHWLGAKSFKMGGSGGIFSFAPEVGRDTAHPVQIRVRSFDAFHHVSRFAAMGKPCFDAARLHREREKGGRHTSGFRAGVLIFAPGLMQAQTTAIDMVTFGMQGKNDGSSIFLPREDSDVPALVPDVLGKSGQGQEGDDEAAMLAALDGDATLKELLKSGVGYAHPGQSLRLRRILSSALRWGHIGVLVSTPSLAWELDIRDAPMLIDPQHTTSHSTSASISSEARLFALAVIIKSSERWSGASRRHLAYPSSLLAQMCGMAGCSSCNGMPPESLMRGVPGPTVTLLVSTESKPRVVAGLAGSLASASSSGEAKSTSATNSVPTIESQIDTHLHDEFLSLVASGAVESRQDALDYLTWTLLYRRLAKNPNYYGMARADAGGALVAEHLSELVEDTLADLGDSGCIDLGDDGDDNQLKQTEDNVLPLNLGMIAAFYAARYTTLEIFAGSMRPRLRIREVLEVLCAASEFEQSDVCRVRQGDGRRVRELSKRCPLRISSVGSSTAADGDDSAVDIHVKANLLIQTYLDRKHSNMLGETQAQRQLFAGKAGEHLRRDRDRVLCVAVRLVKALVDVAAQSCQGDDMKGAGSLRSTLACCELSQLLVMGLSTGDSPLLQIPHMTQAALKRCEAAGDIIEDEDGEKSPIEGVLDILELEDDQRNELLGVTQAQMVDVAEFCNGYPSSEVEVVDVKTPKSTKNGKRERVDPDVPACAPGSNIMLSVSLARDEEDEDESDGEAVKSNDGSGTPAETSPRVLVPPEFPLQGRFARREEWWVIIGDEAKDKILAIKRISLPPTGAIKKKIKFQAPDSTGRFTGKVWLISDSYRGADAEAEIVLDIVE